MRCADLFTTFRTKVADPAFMKDTTEITRLLTKEFGQLIAANVTDVSSVYSFR